jgi:hypothetical protein
MPRLATFSNVCIVFVLGIFASNYRRVEPTLRVCSTRRQVVVLDKSSVALVCAQIGPGAAAEILILWLVVLLFNCVASVGWMLVCFSFEKSVL